MHNIEILQTGHWIHRKVKKNAKTMQKNKYVILCFIVDVTFTPWNIKNSVRNFIILTTTFFSSLVQWWLSSSYLYKQKKKIETKLFFCSQHIHKSGRIWCSVVGTHTMRKGGYRKRKIKCNGKNFSCHFLSRLW